MKTLLQRLRTAFAKLQPRERLLVSAVAALSVLALVWFAGVVPLLDASARAGERVAMGGQQLELMKRLRRDFDEVSQRLTSVEARIQSGGRGNLRTTLEALAGEAAVKIDSMEPQASPTNELYRETKVEVALKEVTLPQTVRYLHGIESTEQVLSVKSLRMRTRPDRPQLLDVTFTVSSFEPL